MIQKINSADTNPQIVFLCKLENSETVPRKRWCDYGQYKHLTCGHVEVLSHHTVRNRKTKFCSQCSLIYYENLVKGSGAKLVGFSRPGKNKNLRADLILPCGHEKSINTTNLKFLPYHCEICWQKALFAGVAKYGAKVLGRVEGSLYEISLKCGCKRTVHISNLRSGNWKCHNCDINYYTRPSNVYLLEITSSDGFSFLKLGFSANVEKRITEYGLKNCSYSVLSTLPFKTGQEAQFFEQSLHLKYKNKKLSVEISKKFLNRQGFTECYPLSIKELILEEFKLNSEENKEG